MHESVVDHFNKRSNSWSHILGTRPHLFKALVLPTLHMGRAGIDFLFIYLGGFTLKLLLEKGMKIHRMFHIKVHISTYHILLAEFSELPMKLYALKLTMGIHQRLAHLPSSWLVTQAT